MKSIKVQDVSKVILRCSIIRVYKLFDDVIVFLFEQELQGSVTYCSHRVIGHSGNEYSEKLVWAGLERQALVVLGAGEHLGHWMLALEISHETMLAILIKYTPLCEASGQAAMPRPSPARGG